MSETPPPLRLPAESMRQIGYRAVDEIVHHLSTLSARPVGRPHDRAALERTLDVGIPTGPTRAQEVLDHVVRHLSSTITHTDHPRFMAYVPGPSNFAGALADFLASGFNVHAAGWILGAGPAIIEQATIDWLCQMCRLPDTSGGLFLSGGTMANLVAVHAARVDRSAAAGGQELVVYVTAQTHASIRRGLRFLGFHDRHVCTVPVDGTYRLDPSALEAAIRRDRQLGRWPVCVVATAGTTNAGTIDPLPAIAEVCGHYRVWLHVDGAYGAPAMLTEAGQKALAGMDLADSIAIDAHKWLFQPYGCGCLLVRSDRTLTAAYSLHAEYLTENRLGDEPLSYYDYGPELTRRFRALKLWMSLRTFGADAFRNAVSHGLALAERAEAVLASRPHWSVTTPAQLGIVTFRPNVSELPSADIDALTRDIAAKMLSDGFAMVLSTELDGRPVLRLCTTHPETTENDLVAVIDRLEALAPGSVAWP